MTFFVPSKQILTPELLIPGKTPVGPAELIKSHPYIKGGGHWYELWRNGAGIAIDKDHNLNGAISGAPTRSLGGTYFDGTDDEIDFGDPASVDYGSGDFRFFADIIPEHTGSSYNVIIGKDAAGAGRQFAFGIGGTSVHPDWRSTIYFTFYCAAVEVLTRTVTSTVTPGNRYKIMVQRIGSSTEIWMNGKLLVTGPTSGTPGTMNSRTTVLNIGRRQYVGAEHFFKGTIFSVGLFSESVSQAVARKMTNDPYALYKPPGPEYLTFSTGAGAIVLSIADLAHAHALDNVALTQAQVLAIADSTHAHTLDAANLTQAQVLAVGDALHAHGLDAVELASGTLLVIADMAHAHTLDPANLVQAQVLAIADALHGHTLDGMTLDLGEVTLVISDLLHTHLLDACNVYPLDSVDTPAGRVFLIEHESRIFAIAAESRIFNVQ